MVKPFDNIFKFTFDLDKKIVKCVPVRVELFAVPNMLGTFGRSFINMVNT